jgi:hypothetical protein
MRSRDEGSSRSEMTNPGEGSSGIYETGRQAVCSWRATSQQAHRQSFLVCSRAAPRHLPPPILICAQRLVEFSIGPSSSQRNLDPNGRFHAVSCKCHAQAERDIDDDAWTGLRLALWKVTRRTESPLPSPHRQCSLRGSCAVLFRDEPRKTPRMREGDRRAASLTCD